VKSYLFDFSKSVAFFNRGLGALFQIEFFCQKMDIEREGRTYILYGHSQPWRLFTSKFNSFSLEWLEGFLN
jgi:hypothetical protein